MLAFALIYLIATVLWGLSAWVAAAYGVASVACFIVYALDKSAAVRQRQRTPERALLLLGLAGGWPGAILAQQWLRHKSAKRSFRRWFWCSVALNVVLLLCLAQLSARYF
ncbi:DUF1294 domain-containing protein [Rugamonas sp.]|uniref:DUF1294 domain-containing protein n=1 Tax=Rugamonas sp. TaxID=1926287 RepID=UPI0025FC2709|nr:DUF1294 domain-containing protein [Rugamonas sp.]